MSPGADDASAVPNQPGTPHDTNRHQSTKDVSMRGHLVQRGDRYDAVVYEGIDPATGKDATGGIPPARHAAEPRRCSAIIGTSNSDPRGQRPEHRDVGRDHAIGAVAVSLDDHLQVLVAEQVGDLAEGDVGVDHQRRDRVT